MDQELLEVIHGPTHRIFNFLFKEVSTVTYGLSFIEAYKSENLRITTEVSDVIYTGFHVRISSWNKTILFGCKITG